MLSTELKQTLKRLRDVPVEYSEQFNGFVYNHSSNHREPKRGLTVVLAELFPVPLVDRDDTDVIARPSKRARPTPDPTPVCTVWRRPSCRTASAETCRVATLHTHVDGLAPSYGASGIGPNFDKRHGKLVDQQVSYIVRYGYSTARTVGMLLDPCTATLRDFFAAHGLAPIGAQVPLYSADLDVATAADVLCTDVATRRELHLFEVKSTTGDSAADANYTRVRGRVKSSAARGTPLSHYVRHQMQLGVMDVMIRETLGDGTALTSSRVLRVSPNCVSVYELTPWFTAASKKLLPVIRRRAARVAKRRQKRKQKQQFLTK